MAGWDPVKSITMGKKRAAGESGEFAPIIEQLGLTLINVFQLPVTDTTSDSSFGASEVISTAFGELGVTVAPDTINSLLSNR